MLKIYIGRAGSGKTAKIMNEINEYVKKSHHNLILVVPEQYSHDAERLLCETCGDSASLYAQVLSFTRMCNRAFAELGGIADKFLDDAGKILVMSRAVELASDYTKVYGGLSKKSEFIKKLTATAKEFKSSQISISDINAAAINARPALKDKLEDISVIFQIYWSLMQNEVRDPDERLDRLADMILQTEFTKNCNIWFDGFYDFTAQQYAVIKELLKCSDNITFCLNCDDIYSDEPIFESSRETAKKLIKMASELGVEHEIVIFDKYMSDRPRGIRCIEEILVSNTCDDKEDSVAEVSAFCCANFTEECEVAAAKALEFVMNGSRFKDIAVAVGGFDAYTSVLPSVFEKYGVPVYFNSKLDVLNTPPVMTIISALKIIYGGWSYEDVFSYLKTGFANISREDCDILENYVLMWNIRGSMWYRDEDWTFSQGGYKDAADEKILERINLLRKAVIKPLAELQERFENAANNADMITALCDFIDSIDLIDKIESRSVAYTSESNKYMADCYLALGEMLTSVFEQFYNVAGEYCCKTDELIYQLSMLFSNYDIGVIPTGVDCVAVGDFSRMRMHGVKHLIVLGMTDENVPLLTQADGIFSDSERDELIAIDLGLSQNSVQRLYGDITSVYEVLTLPKKTLTMMYPCVDSAANGLAPSYVFNNITEALKIEIVKPSKSDYKLFAKKPCEEYAAANGEFDGTAAAAITYFADDEYYKSLRSAVKQLEKLHKKVLSPESAKKLYGDKVTMTASRVDKYKACKYSYFLQYGLKAKPRTKAEFDASVIGTFMHYILENVTSDIESLGGFKTVSEAVCTELVRKYVAEFVENELQNMQDKSARFQYLFNSLTEDAVSVVRNMAAELKNSDYRPLDFELDFSRSGDLPPYEISDNESSLAVRGVVDRVDGWIHDGKLYVRVVDYKTGVKSFSLSDVWYGMGLQMLIYLFALRNMGKDRYGMDIVPSGVLYAPAKEVLLSESRHVTDGELEKNRLKNLKRSGLILDDEAVINAMEHGESKVFLPIKTAKDGSFTGESLASAEQLGLLAKHIDKTLLEISKEIFTGNVSADPYFRSQVDNSCMYCDYYHACHYSEETDGEYRSLTKLKTPDVWTSLQKEAEQ